MIDYSPFWNTIKKKKISTYYLIKTCRVSSSTLTRLRRNMPLTTVTLDDLCRFLNCEIQEILQYVPDKQNDEK